MLRGRFGRSREKNTTPPKPKSGDSKRVCGTISKKSRQTPRSRCGLFHHQHWAMSELYDAIGTTADHSLVQSRMSRCSDDEQINLEFGGEFNDVPHGMPGQQMGL